MEPQIIRPGITFFPADRSDQTSRGCMKMPFDSEGEAAASLERCIKKRQQGDVHRREIDYYHHTDGPDACGQWHLTSITRQTQQRLNGGTR